MLLIRPFQDSLESKLYNPDASFNDHIEGAPLN